MNFAKQQNRTSAFEQGRRDFSDRQFLNPYRAPVLRTQWLKGFSEAAQSNRNASRLATGEVRA